MEDRDMKAMLILAMIELILTKGIPAYIAWKDGVTLEDPTLEDVKALSDIKRPEEF
jgi:hypothetical protein